MGPSLEPAAAEVEPTLGGRQVGDGRGEAATDARAHAYTDVHTLARATLVGALPTHTPFHTREVDVSCQPWRRKQRSLRTTGRRLPGCPRRTPAQQCSCRASRDVLLCGMRALLQVGGRPALHRAEGGRGRARRLASRNADQRRACMRPGPSGMRARCAAYGPSCSNGTQWTLRAGSRGASGKCGGAVTAAPSAWSAGWALAALRSAGQRPPWGPPAPPAACPVRGGALLSYV